MADQPYPTPDLGPGGARLWADITEDHELTTPQLVQLEEACRMKDRLDEFDRIIHGRGVLELMRFRLEIDDVLADPTATINVRFDGVIDKANTTANAMKQLLASLRLPDESGVKPQRRGGARGSYGATTPGGKSEPASAAKRAASRWGA